MMDASNGVGVTGAALAAGASCTFGERNRHPCRPADRFDGGATSVEGGTGTASTASVTVDQGTTQTVVGSSGSIHFGQTATFTATVSSTAGIPTGAVTFMDGIRL